MKIGNKEIGKGKPLYFIADIAANHDGDINRAFKLIELAKEAGADAAKFQNFKAKTIVSKKGFAELGSQVSHQAKWKKSVYNTYEDASISSDWTKALKEKCDQVGIDYFTSPYDFPSVDIVDPFVEVYKVGSGDITWIEILEYMAAKGKPMILATGASTMEDVDRAVTSVSNYTKDIVLMQCNTNYTGAYENFNYINLNVLNTYAQKFPKVVLGLSDHTHGHSTVLGAVALGAVVFEKHFTDDNERIGPDHKFAMNPKSWKEMVVRANELYLALGNGVKQIEKNEESTVLLQRRSLRLNKDLAAGHILTNKDFFPLRPASQIGFEPYEASRLIGKELIVDVKTDELLVQKMLKKDD